MTKLFHYFHYVSYLFAIPAIYYILHGSVFRPKNFIEEVGLGIFFMGFTFAFSSMSDIKKISEKERKLFSNPKKYKQKVLSIISLGIAMAIACIFFISIKWIGGDKLQAEKFYHLGLNCMPIVIAIFFELKQINDKKSYFDLINE
ncbi:hypothetical protein L3073_04665 [Ancylomarina sp. DW003]|nr:hypothetical protein [Ancylomarina sp. DW003]MDE5421488.1 hypothetical protein [Ancylomarina sp. DW003]